MRARSRLPVHMLINVAIIGALVGMLYPLIWMLSASFKTGYEIFHSLSLLPQAPTLDNYISGWTALRLPLGVFFMNSVVHCAAVVLGNTLSCTLAAFAFARLRLPLKRVLFAVMLMTIMLPFHATIVPQFVLYEHLGWVGTILPIVAPKFLAVDAFFVFLLVQKIDGCGPFRLFYLGDPPAPDAGAGDDRDIHFHLHLERLLLPAALPGQQRHFVHSAGRLTSVHRRHQPELVAPRRWRCHCSLCCRSSVSSWPSSACSSRASRPPA